jgi:hypothetical protein
MIRSCDPRRPKPSLGTLGFSGYFDSFARWFRLSPSPTPRLSAWSARRSPAVSRAPFLTALLALVLAAAMLAPAPATATPIFAQRYRFKCTVCHTVIPELNSFGEHFRNSGFNIPDAPRHGYFPLVLRFQESYVKDLLPSQTRRFNALAILISTANFGKDNSYSYFARYFFGSQGAPGSLYYAYVQHVSQHNGVFERLGEFNLPVIQNATQRLDALTPQEAYTYTVGHNDANFTTPRWGAEFGQRDDRTDFEIALSFDEYRGAAYGVPAPPSDLNQSFAGPEVFASAKIQASRGLYVGGLGMAGARLFQSRTSGLSFTDHYEREGVQAEWESQRLRVFAQQLWGRDDNPDGFGTVTGSSGGFVTVKYYPIPHGYLGIRYDAVANPFAKRDFVYYLAFAPTIHARFVLEQFQPIGPGFAQTSAQVLFAVPFEGRGATGPK